MILDSFDWEHICAPNFFIIFYEAKLLCGLPIEICYALHVQ